MRESRITEHSVDKWQDDELSIVASEEEHSADGQSVSDPEDSKSPKTAPVDLVRRETRAVMVLRYLIITLLLSCAILMTWGTFRWVGKAEENQSGSSNVDSSSSSSPNSCAWTGDDLEEAFAQALERNLQQAQQARYMAAYSLSASFTSSVLEVSGIWPTISIPDFESRLKGIVETTGALQVRLAPFVSVAMRTTFEQYAVEEQQTACSTCPVVQVITDPSGSPASNSEETLPIWQLSPAIKNETLTLQNLLGNPVEATAARRMEVLGAGVLSDIRTTTEAPRVTLYYPVYTNFQQEQLASAITMVFQWSDILQHAMPFDVTLPVQKEPYFYVLVESCSEQIFSYELDSETHTVTYSGQLATIPDSVKEAAVVVKVPGAYPFGDFSNPVEQDDVCNYSLWVVPSAAISELMGTSSTDDDSNRQVLLTVIVAVLFFVIICVFLVYDWLVEKRQSVVVNIATKSSAIVENLFPAQVRDRMLQNMHKKDDDQDDGGNDPNNKGKQMDSLSKNVLPSMAGGAPGPVSVKQFLTSDSGMNNNLSSPPIADLFPNTTVLFADIAGFTAWSSQREPPQVFTLLETLYRSFDVIAKKLKVFKVETIGDCYMAVTGLPNPDDAHAVHMSRFAYQCLVGMKELIRELEAMLGPGTSDLALRVGLHSGAVTAGVLRGEKSRFQLFGDTVNTASRMESTGMRGKIQVSQETGDLLMAAGKSHWLKPREEAVVAKGKGELKTYWLDPTKKRRPAKQGKDIRVAPEIAINGGGTHIEKPASPGDVPFDDKYARLIDWNVDVLLHHLARVISTRSRSPSRGSLVNHSSEVALLPAAINDVAEVVALPPFDADTSRFRRARPDVSMLQQTRSDLHEYVKRIAIMYRDVPFHNFEHASHVTLCANKLLNRLINSEEYETEDALHNATFGISSDPLTHFAIVFAALIHDVDHTGLPNAQLVKDGHELASKFKNRSVAEQNSVHLGWETLMDPRFERLRKCIYQTNVERKRFRQLVINSVMATDIADRQVNEERQQKWERAFQASKVSVSEQSPLQIQEDMNRKATAVIEHIIQVSDVAHTMQHWHIYRRWNERLFHEMHDAFSSGKVNVDPSTNWYIGELGFFDYYLIPLAMKLKECGVFGASGYEYISYVLKNKKEWERKGRQVVQEMVLLYKDVEEEHSGSSFESDDYDSDDLEYDSPGDMSSSEEDVEDDEEEEAKVNQNGTKSSRSRHTT